MLVFIGSFNGDYEICIGRKIIVSKPPESFTIPYDGKAAAGLYVDPELTEFDIESKYRKFKWELIQKATQENDIFIMDERLMVFFGSWLEGLDGLEVKYLEDPILKVNITPAVDIEPLHKKPVNKKSWEIFGLDKIATIVEIDGEQIPFILKDGTLIVPETGPDKYKSWKGGQSIRETIDMLEDQLTKQEYNKMIENYCPIRNDKKKRG